MILDQEKETEKRILNDFSHAKRLRSVLILKIIKSCLLEEQVEYYTFMKI